MSSRPQHSDGATAIGEVREAPQRLTREDVAKIEVGQTDVPRWLSVVITMSFIGLILLVPLTQSMYEAAQGQSIQAFDLFRHTDRIRAAWRAHHGDLYAKIFAANAETLRQINDFEDALEDASWMKVHCLGPVTEFQARWLSAGNEQAYIGRDGWLFFRMDVDHLTGPGFLDADRLATRAAGGNEFSAPPQPDPRPAILQFRDQLASRAIHLIVMPVPVKPVVASRQLSSRYEGRTQPLYNGSYQQFVDQMRQAQVDLFDPSDLLAESDSYLRTDTHWTPSAMQRVAAALATRVETLGAIPPAVGYEGTNEQVTHLGDIAVMLNLPDDQTLYAPQEVTIRRVTGPPVDEPAQVLLLGDSFTNIYSMEDLGWGTQAGLAEQLGYELQNPVDRIALNAGGAHASRGALVADLARGQDRLSDIRVVIWQFAMRELSSGDWQLMDLPVVATATPSTKEGPARSIAVTGTVAAKAKPPRPGSVPYRDAIIAIQLTDMKGGDLPDTVLVYAWGLRDNRLVDVPLQVGLPVTLMLTPWAEVQERYGQYNRFELDDPDALFLDAYWGEVTR